MGTPFGPSTTGAAAGSDAAAIKHDRHVVGSFRLTSLTGHHCSTEVEAFLVIEGQTNIIREDNRNELDE